MTDMDLVARLRGRLAQEHISNRDEQIELENAHSRYVAKALADHESLKSELINLRWALEHDDRVVDDPFPFIDRLLDKFFDYKVAENCQIVCPDCDGSGQVKCGEMDSGAPITHGCERCDGTGECDH